MSTPIRVIIVDDHPVVRFGIAAIIGLQPDMALAGEAGSGEEACTLCAKKPVLGPRRQGFARRRDAPIDGLPVPDR